MFNDPKLPGRFFQKKAELEKVLKVAWDYQSLTPEQQKLMGPKAPHVMSIAKQEMDELVLEIDELKAQAMNNLRGERQEFVNEFLSLLNTLQAQLRNGGTNTEEAQKIFGALGKKMDVLRIGNDFRSEFNYIFESYWRIVKRFMKSDESLAYASAANASIIKTASGYSHPEIPGRFFQEKSTLELVLAKKKGGVSEKKKKKD